jgi:hypothetical protein
MNLKSGSFALLLALAFVGCQAPQNTPPPPPPVPPGEAVSGTMPVPIDMAAAGSKPIVFHKAIVTMDSGTPFGKVTGGLLNVQWATFKVNPGEEPKQFISIGTEELRKAHYSLPGDSNRLFEDDSEKARYELGAEITWMQLDIHLQAGWSKPTIESNGGITVKWQVYDTVQKTVVFKRSLDSGFHEVTKGDTGEPPLFGLFRTNVRLLLADPGFAEFMKPDPAPVAPAPAAASPTPHS